jgi:hypothetical protein
MCTYSGFPLQAVTSVLTRNLTTDLTDATCTPTLPSGMCWGRKWTRRDHRAKGHREVCSYILGNLLDFFGSILLHKKVLLKPLLPTDIKPMP